MTTPKKFLFETKVCSRCCGSGEFSYCSMYGKVCFKCGGAGAVLTKKGAAAARWFRAKKMKPASEVKVGDRIVVEGCPGFSRTEVVVVESCEMETRSSGKSLLPNGEWKEHPPHLVIRGKGAKSGEPHGMHVFPESEIRMHVWGEELIALKSAAKAYEATLTMAGTVKKGKAK